MDRKLACYYPKDVSKGNYEGNTFMHQERGAMKVYGTVELASFLNSMVEKTTSNKSEQLHFFTDVNNSTNVIEKNAQNHIVNM